MIVYNKIRRYKYRLQKEYIREIKIHPEYAIGNEYVTLDSNGRLTITKGYCWDGPSGPTIDTPDFMEGSLVHDVLYQLMREGHISRDFQYYADKLLVEICRKKGMGKLRAWWVYNALRIVGSINTNSDIITIE